jgi:hypothetical protein
MRTGGPDGPARASGGQQVLLMLIAGVALVVLSILMIHLLGV